MCKIRSFAMVAFAAILFLTGLVPVASVQAQEQNVAATAQSRRVKDLLRKSTFKSFLRREANRTSDAKLKAAIKEVLDNDALLNQAYGEIGNSYEQLSAGALTDFLQWLVDNREAIMEWIMAIIDLFSDNPNMMLSEGPQLITPQGEIVYGANPAPAEGPTCPDCPGCGKANTVDEYNAPAPSGCPTGDCPTTTSYTHSETTYTHYGTRGSWRFAPSAPGPVRKGVGAVAKGAGKIIGVQRRQNRRSSRHGSCGC